MLTRPCITTWAGKVHSGLNPLPHFYSRKVVLRGISRELGGSPYLGGTGATSRFNLADRISSVVLKVGWSITSSTRLSYIAKVTQGGFLNCTALGKRALAQPGTPERRSQHVLRSGGFCGSSHFLAGFQEITAIGLNFTRRLPKIVDWEVHLSLKAQLLLWASLGLCFITLCDFWGYKRIANIQNKMTEQQGTEQRSEVDSQKRLRRVMMKGQTAWAGRFAFWALLPMTWTALQGVQPEDPESLRAAASFVPALYSLMAVGHTTFAAGLALTVPREVASELAEAIESMLQQGKDRIGWRWLRATLPCFALLLQLTAAMPVMWDMLVCCFLNHCGSSPAWDGAWALASEGVCVSSVALYGLAGIVGATDDSDDNDDDSDDDDDGGILVGAYSPTNG